MSINGKYDDFDAEDLITYASHAGLKRNRSLKLLNEVHEAVSSWQIFANAAAVESNQKNAIAKFLRLNLR